MNSSLLIIIKEVFDTDDETIMEEFDLRDLEGWDSLRHMMFVARLEKEYEIVLSGDDIADMLSLASIRRILETKHNIQA